MSYLFDLKFTTRRYLAQLEEVNKEIKAVEGKRAIYSKETFEPMLAEVEAKKAALVAKAQQEVKNLTATYKATVKGKFALDGAALTDDAKLLTSGLKLTQADLETIFDRNQGNYTMQRLVTQFARDNDIFLDRVFYDEDSKNGAADIMELYCVSALKGHEAQAAVVDSDSLWTQVTPSAIAGD